jgi:hypothetical protein
VNFKARKLAAQAAPGQCGNPRPPAISLHFYPDIMRRTRDAIGTENFNAFRAQLVAGCRPHLAEEE